jgi:carbon-monoxide dehydrogenase medium subunit
MEESLSNNWSKSSVESVKLSPEGIMSDIHGSSEYRANLANIMAIRAFEGIDE